jgi:hypothetical protein
VTGPLHGRPRWRLRSRINTLLPAALQLVGLEYWIVGLTCGFGCPWWSCCNLILAGEPAEDGSAADLMVGQVDRWWELVFGLDWCELPDLA